MLENADVPHQIFYGAVYVTPQGHRYVDYWYEIIDMPRVFEWNIMHHSLLANSCVDIDGVLCRDPTERENDDGEEYRSFLVNAQPLIVPTETIGWLVTCRLEKYRDLTEQWLKDHNLNYNHLLMMDLPDKETRVALKNHAHFKANIYRSVDSTLFIESSIHQAQAIAWLTGKPVFCTETWQMINADRLTQYRNRGAEYASELRKDPFNALVKLGRFSRAALRSLKWKMLARLRR